MRLPVAGPGAAKFESNGDVEALSRTCALPSGKAEMLFDIPAD